MASEKKIFSFTNPVLQDHGKNLSKRWYIRYDDVYAGGVKKPRRVWVKFRRSHSIEKREAAVAEAMQQALDRINNYQLYLSPELERSMFNHVRQITQVKNDRKKTIQCYESKARMFCRWCELNGLHREAQLNADVMKHFFHHLQQEKKLNPNTINDYRILLRTICRRIGHDEYMTGISKLKESPVSALMFQKHQQEQIINYLKEHDRWLLLFVYTMFYTLQRPGKEIPLMKLIDINSTDGTIRVDAERAKTGRERKCTLPDPLYQIFAAYGILNFPLNYYVFGKDGPSDIPVGRDHWSKRHMKVLHKLGFPKGYSTYSWNHTGAVAMFRALKDVVQLMHQKGHTTLAVTQRYIHQHAQPGNEELRTRYPTL